MVEVQRKQTETAYSKQLSTTSSRRRINKFVDTQFPADLSSLLDTEQRNGGLSDESVEFFRNITYVRASAVYPNICTLLQTVQPGSIRQGKLGDVYFLSALSVLAENANNIRKLFTKHDLAHSKFAV